MAPRRKSEHTKRRKKRAARPSPTQLDRLIAEATVDAYNESEQVGGLYTMMEESLAVPFTTELLGVAVTVEGVDLTDDDRIVAVCRRGKTRQRISILDLPLPEPPPQGAQWIHAFRRWVG
ncbi:MAG: calcium-binding protein [Gemmatimonadota bacterium]|mgnify:CR=1 FL=1